MEYMVRIRREEWRNGEVRRWTRKMLVKAGVWMIQGRCERRLTLSRRSYSSTAGASGGGWRQPAQPRRLIMRYNILGSFVSQYALG